MSLNALERISPLLQIDPLNAIFTSNFVHWISGFWNPGILAVATSFKLKQTNCWLIECYEDGDSNCSLERQFDFGGSAAAQVIWGWAPGWRLARAISRPKQYKEAGAGNENHWAWADEEDAWEMVIAPWKMGHRSARGTISHHAGRVWRSVMHSSWTRG